MLVSKSSLTTFLVKSSINVCAHLYECVQLERKFSLRITSSLGPDQFAKRYPVSEEAYTIYLALQKHTLPLSWQINRKLQKSSKSTLLFNSLLVTKSKSSMANRNTAIVKDLHCSSLSHSPLYPGTHEHYTTTSLCHVENLVASNQK